jgi:mono/diheme cytochrome c family protein
LIATNITTTVAVIIAIVFIGGWLVYGALNLRAGRKEVGSEIELAANRKQYYDDEYLEGPKLERTQLLGVLLLAVLTIGLPIYWILEPGRQKGNQAGWDARFVRKGAALFDVTANGGFNCAGCHGGMKAGGGGAPYTLTDPNTGEIKAVTWNAPALDTVLYRYSADEVRFVLTYGRPFSPMSAWGVDGGGPMNDQQIDWLVAYIKSIQLPPVGCKAGATTFDIRRGPQFGNRDITPADPAVCDGGHVASDLSTALQQQAEADVASGKYKSIGEALFSSTYKAGSFSCARCHTRGWSYGDPKQTGGGALGPNLTGGSVDRQCVTKEELTAFLKVGSHYGAKYCENGQGSGRMPGFGGILTDQQLQAIANYVRGL